MSDPQELQSEGMKCVHNFGNVSCKAVTEELGVQYWYDPLRKVVGTFLFPVIFNQPFLLPENLF
jgi:hypothetical protein